jgi:hypothetical protein
MAIYTTLMSTGLTFGTIAALYGLTNGYIDQPTYTILVTVVILSAVVPTLVATTFFEPATSSTDKVSSRRRAAGDMIASPRLDYLASSQFLGTNRDPVVRSVLFPLCHDPVAADGRVTAGKVGRDLIRARRSSEPATARVVEISPKPFSRAAG